MKQQDIVSANWPKRRIMTAELLPTAAQAEYLTNVFRRSGLLDGGSVAEVAVESSRATVLSRIIRLRLTYERLEADAPSAVVLNPRGGLDANNRYTRRGDQFRPTCPQSPVILLPQSRRYPPRFVAAAEF
jgi:hypothetical protein